MTDREISHLWVHIQLPELAASESTGHGSAVLAGFAAMQRGQKATQWMKINPKDGCGNGRPKGSDLLFPFHLMKESIRMRIAFLRPWQSCTLPSMNSALKEGGAWCPLPAGRCLFSSQV